MFLENISICRAFVAHCVAAAHFIAHFVAQLVVHFVARCIAQLLAHVIKLTYG